MRDINNYVEYVKYLEDHDWEKESITIYEYLSGLVTINSLKKGNDGVVTDITCPPGRIISISKDYPLEVKFANFNGDELSPDTQIKTIKKKILRKNEVLYDLRYKDISMLNYSSSPNKFKNYSELFRFEKGIELKGEDHLKIQVINPNIDIDAEKVKLNLVTNLWTLME